LQRPARIGKEKVNKALIENDLEVEFK